MFSTWCWYGAWWSRQPGRATVHRFGLGAVVYPVVASVGLVSPPAMFVRYAGLTAFYIFGQSPVLAAAS